MGPISFPCGPTGAPKRVSWEAGSDSGAKGSKPGGGPIPRWQHLQLQVGSAGSLVSGPLSPIIHAGNWPACPARPQR